MIHWLMVAVYIWAVTYEKPVEEVQPTVEIVQEK